MDFTANWLWPQWVMASMLFLGFAITSAQHGKQRLQAAGDEKGKPERYNGFVALGRVGLWVFILVAGGFFR